MAPATTSARCRPRPNWNGARRSRPSAAGRVADTMATKKESGWVGGHTPIGYARVNKVLVVDPEWAPKVVVIFELYATGRFSFETLARHLNSELKLRAPDRRWKVKGKWH